MKIKICGLWRDEDVAVINRTSADYAGFVVEYPTSHRSVNRQRLEMLTSSLDRPRIKAVGVFVDKDVHFVADLLKGGVIDIAQLHGCEDEDYVSELKAMSSKPVIKAFVIGRGDAAKTLERAEKTVADYVLFDSGRGSGTAFDYSILKGFERKYFIAGGLGVHNIEQLLNELSPFAIDLSSSVESARQKDEKKIQEVVQLVKSDL